MPRQGEANRELAAQAGSVAVGADRPSVQLDQTLDQREADPQSTVAASLRGVCLGEQVEDAGQGDRVDPDPAVAHPRYRLISRLLDGQPDLPARLRVLRGVVQEVCQYLLQ